MKDLWIVTRDYLGKTVLVTLATIVLMCISKINLEYNIRLKCF